MPEARVGASGYSYPNWRGLFYPPGLPGARQFAYYCERFDTVEINRSFYSLPSPENVRAWREAAPPDFLFAVKASRYITHQKKLKDPELALPRFLDLLPHFGDKLGPVLFQLPPRFRANLQRLDEFLEVFRRRMSDQRCAFEFRDPDWHQPEVLDILRRHDAAFCLFELSGVITPRELTAGYVYIRLHGPGDEAYAGRYDQIELGDWASAIRDWLNQGLDVYCYFDNDQDANSVLNAEELRAMLR